MKFFVQRQLSRSEEVFMFDSDEDEGNEDEEEDKIQTYPSVLLFESACLTSCYDSYASVKMLTFNIGLKSLQNLKFQMILRTGWYILYIQFIYLCIFMYIIFLRF